MEQVVKIGDMAAVKKWSTRRRFRVHFKDWGEHIALMDF